MKGRKFTTFWMLGALLAGGLLRWRHHPGASRGFWIAGVSVGVCGALFPARMQWFERGWTGLTKFLNKAVAYLLALLIFVVALTPLALLFRIFRRDELRLRQPKTDTYWQPHEKITGPDAYRHLY